MAEKEVQYRAYTQTFKPDVINNTMTPKHQWELVIRDLIEVLRMSCDFVIYAELTVQNILHFHGILTLRRPAMFASKTVKMLTQRFGHLKLSKFNAVMTKDGWLKYCEKDKELMTDVLGDNRPNPVTQDSRLVVNTLVDPFDNFVIYI